ncbi:MAG: hypothetical protein QF733_04520 [Phycisphaerales bacterium]|jgi:hypothetical protein|nr:hypothetical protein [Phycisphaerales bacterium]
MLRLCGAVALVASGVALAGPFDGEDSNTQDAEGQRPRLTLLQQEVPGLRVHRAADGRIDRLYGKVFATGDSARDTAARFIEANASIWGVDAADLREGGVLPGGVVVQPMMYDSASDTYKFEGVYFSQWAGEYPVFESRLMVLTRAQADHGGVWAGADLRDLGSFVPSRPAEALTGEARMTALARQLLGDDSAFLAQQPRTVVFAGYDEHPAAPTMAVEFVAEAGGNWLPSTHQKRRYVVRADDGAVLHDENMILSCAATEMPIGAMVAASLGEVTGTVNANTTASTRAAECDPEFLSGLPYAAVTADGTTVYADAGGGFTHPYSGGGTSFGGAIGGRWFSVNNQAGSEATAYASGGSGDSISINYNASPTDLVTAQVNAYKEANLIRDMVLAMNPSYPTITGQTGWPINVNLNDTCNAYYDYSSINFYQSGGGCNNTAFSVIAHHEYGHHLVAVGGSGQGEYGEGMGDVMGVVLTGDSELARGFYSSDCNNGIRTADNNCQYSASGCSSCGSQIHACGQLISGCVWDTWVALEASSPLNAQQIIRDLSVNSILMHSGTSITDSIAIDFVTLDDDDGNVDNGSPHYFEIAEGFGLHGLDVPELALLSITAPNGLPDFISPAGGSAIDVRIANLQGQFEDGSGRVFIGQDGSYTQYALEALGGDDYQAVFPATDCGDAVDYFFAADTTVGMTVYWPGDAPSTAFSVQSAYGEPIVSFEEYFDDEGEFTASGSAGDGQWTHGIPVNCDRGDPPSDFDGNGRCWLTDNSSANGCNSDVDDGTVYLTSPAMDASEPGMSLCYARWFSNDYGASPYTDTFVVQVSDDDGASWLTLETVGPAGDEVSGGWYDVCFVLESVSGFDPTSTMRVRFSTSDASSSGSVVEAAVDAIVLSVADCEDDNPCPSDINGDGQTDVDDILAVIAAFGSGAGGDVDGDGDTDVDDLLAAVGGFGPC